jgi:hypothetical protein
VLLVSSDQITIEQANLSALPKRSPSKTQAPTIIANKKPED